MTLKSILFGMMVLLFTSQSQADCAWVLWNKYQSTDGSGTSTEWELHGAYVRKEQCEDVKKRVWQVLADKSADSSGIEIKKVPYDAVFRTGRKGSYYSSEQLYCLPDTVDPRR